MWYFAWVLGLAFASAFAILNAIWFEIHHDQARPDQGAGQKASLHRS